MGKTLFEKIWDAHVVGEESGQTILYIDKHLIHEVTTPQGFEGLRLAKRKVRRPDATMGVIDHIIPTENQTGKIDDPMAAAMLAAMQKNAPEFGVPLFNVGDPRNGIIHVVAP